MGKRGGGGDRERQGGSGVGDVGEPISFITKKYERLKPPSNTAL